MKSALFAAALLIGSAAGAQTAEFAAYDGDGAATAAWETEGGAAMPGAVFGATGHVVEPDNSNPELDARGIAVISAPAVVPAGWNGTEADAMGGPLLDAATGETVAEVDYPACTAMVTDNCVQIYEKGRSAR